MTETAAAIDDVARYAPLGLIANPFAMRKADESVPATGAEVSSESNRLLSAIVGAAAEPEPRPIRIDKSGDVPSYYHARAISEVEHALVNDEDLNVLHAYVQLFMMRRGRVRAVLQALGERIAFRSFDQTLAAYVASVLEAPDESLASYAVIGSERLAAFREEFDADPTATVLAYFGDLELERQPDLAQVADVRLGGLEPDVEPEAEADEVDSALPVALGTGFSAEFREGETSTDESASDAGNDEIEDAVDDRAAVVDYLIEHTKVHFSAVIARALRVYRDRGLAAMAIEFRVTKAPRKTLAAVVKLARFRFRKVVLIFDGFDGWHNVPDELRVKIAASLSEMRWMLAKDVIMVVMLEKDRVRELEEQFASAVPLDWRFPRLAAIEDARDALDPAWVDAWLACAASPGATPIDVTQPVLATLLAEAGGSAEFVTRAAAAIEDAADRKLGTLDDASLEAARSLALEA